MAEPLAQAFAPPAQADWLKLVEKVLKGATPETLTRTTADGLAVRPLYTEANPVSAAPAPSALRPGGWDLRTRIAAPARDVANRAGREDLAGGASSLLFQLDPAGWRGSAVGCQDELHQVLAGIELDLAPVAIDANYMGPLAAEWLGAIAKKAPQAQLAFHIDPITTFAFMGASPGPVDAHIARGAQVSARQSADYPKATFFLASGLALHEHGGSDAQELGAMLAAASRYLRALVDAGLTPQRAFEGVVLGVSVDGDFLSSMAKVRAVRLLWRQLTRASGLETPARVEARSSKRMLTREDPWTNLLRLTAAGFAAAVGGADAIVLDAFTVRLGPPPEMARRQARNIQLVLMEEAQLRAVDDPAAGAWALDQRTEDLARAAWSIFCEIERSGGLVAALASGRIAEQVSAAAAIQREAYVSGEAKLLGVNLYRNSDAAPLELGERLAASTAAPDVRLPGADDTCPPMKPIAWEDAL